MSRLSVAILGLGLLAQSPKAGTIEATWVDEVRTEDGQKRELGRIVVRRQGELWMGNPRPSVGTSARRRAASSPWDAKTSRSKVLASTAPRFISPSISITTVPA